MNILWDFDGTLFDTYPAYTQIFKEFLEHHTDKEIYDQLKVSFTQAFVHFGVSKQLQRDIRAKVRALEPKDMHPFPYVIDVLKLADKNVIMTHKEREDVLKVLEYHQLSQYFVDMVAGDDGFPRKPDSSSYQHLHKKYYINLAIGDREIDILPAKELGMKTCLFQNHTPGADFYLDNYAQFQQIVLSQS